MVQGLAVLCMVWLHLFDRQEGSLFMPILYLNRIPLSFYVAQLSDFCVMAFAFCTGFVHFKRYGESHYYRNRLKGLLRVLIDFWVILVIFTIVSMVVGNGNNIPGSASKWIQNALMIDNSYNGAWWYLYAYAGLILLSPFIGVLVKKTNTVALLFFAATVYVISYVLRFYVFLDGIILMKIGPFGMTLFEYLLGSIFCKENLFERIYTKWKQFNIIIRCSISIGLIVVLLLVRTLYLPNMIFAPASGIVIIILFVFWKKQKIIENFFLFIGKHSTNIWLTHMFFYLSIFPNLVYKAKEPVLIFLFMIGITLIVSIILHIVQNYIKRMAKLI